MYDVDYKSKPLTYCPKCSNQLNYIMKQNYGIPCIVYYCSKCKYSMSKAITLRGNGGR